MGVSPAAAPDAPTYVTLDFVKGVPVAIDGEKMKASDIIRKLNKLGGENGIGLLDIVENRLVGMKDRGVYETPGGTILYRAHEVLEMITLDKDTKHMKSKLAVDFADLIYNGKWFTPLREALQAFAVDTQKHVTGQVKLKLPLTIPQTPSRFLNVRCTCICHSPQRMRQRYAYGSNIAAVRCGWEYCMNEQWRIQDCNIQSGAVLWLRHSFARAFSGDS